MYLQCCSLNRLRANGVLYKHRVYDSMRRTYSKEKRKWTNVRLEDVTPIISFLLVGIMVSLVQLLLERVTASRISIQHRRNGFAVRQIDADHPAHLCSSQSIVSREVENNCDLRDFEHPVSSHIV
jgi:hypothetical protein